MRDQPPIRFRTSAAIAANERIILDHYADRFDAFRRDMGDWVAAGRVKLREYLVDGLENAPAAFIGLLEGRNFGKLVVRIA